MPKSIVIEPEVVFTRGRIHFSDIEVNAYSKTIEEELSVYSLGDFVNMLEDMCAIREFEWNINEIKIKGTCKGITYSHPGPAHLCMGQEAAAVGMAYSLTPDDHIYGSHRSHGEILAKGFSAIRQMSDEELLRIMRSYLDGAILKPLEDNHTGSVQALARKFMIYGAYS
jgi:2-oxoisovalerate dehydrogenase E1 component